MSDLVFHFDCDFVAEGDNFECILDDRTISISLEIPIFKVNGLSGAYFFISHGLDFCAAVELSSAYKIFKDHIIFSESACFICEDIFDLS